MRLPPELCDETIDYLWDDVDALRACSLTCQAWLPASRFHLFRNLRLRNADDVSRFRALLVSAPSTAQCVRKLSLSADYDGTSPDGQAREDDGWVDETTDLLPLLTEVTTLALARVRWHSLSAETRAAFEHMSRSVRQLFLFEVSFAASRDVIAFLSAFPSLRDLYFHAVSWKEDSPSPFDEQDASEVQSRMQLSYLFLDPKSSPTLVTEWLLRRPGEPHLQTIQLCWRALADTKPLGDLLTASGAALEELRVEFPVDVDVTGAASDGALGEHLSLAHNTSLRALHFGGLDARVSAARRLFPWVTAMLAQVPARRLQEVAFELAIASVADLRALDWTQIDAYLAREELRGLSVMFYVACDKDGVQEDVRREISDRLERFQTRGTLSVSCI